MHRLADGGQCPRRGYSAQTWFSIISNSSELVAAAVLVRTTPGGRSQALCSFFSRQCYDAPAMNETENVSSGDLGRRAKQAGGMGSMEGPAPQHATYFAVIRQAMSEEFRVSRRARASALGPPCTERPPTHCHAYLADLRADFQRSLRLARVVAVLSEVAASHECERLRLSMCFFWRYRMLVLGLSAGLLLFPQLRGLSQMVSELAFRMDLAVKELGQRAAIVAQLASTLNRRGLDMA